MNYLVVINLESNILDKISIAKDYDQIIDHRNPEDILNEGHIDNNVRIAIKNGMDSISAIKVPN